MFWDAFLPLFKIIGQLFAFLGVAVLQVFVAIGTAPKVPLILAVCAAIAWIGAAAAASAVVERAGHCPGRHFATGIVLPFVYPAGVIAWCMLRPEEAPVSDMPPGEPEVEEQPAGAGQREEAEASGQHAAEGDAAVSETFDKKYFDDLKTQQDREELVPGWELTFGGRTIRVIEISEVLPNVVAFRTRNADGQVQTMRVPYQRIEAWKPIETDNGETGQ